MEVEPNQEDEQPRTWIKPSYQTNSNKLNQIYPFLKFRSFHESHVFRKDSPKMAEILSLLAFRVYNLCLHCV